MWREILTWLKDVCTIKSRDTDAGLLDDFYVQPTSIKRRLYGCGHKGSERFVLHFWEERLFRPIPGFCDPNTCPDCILNKLKHVVIRCARCGLPIYPSDRILLYEVELSRIEWTTLDGNMAIGCTRMACLNGATVQAAGIWTGRGILNALGKERTLT